MSPRINLHRLWYTRSVMGFAVLIYGFLAYLYAVNPLAGIDMFGVSLSGEAHSITFLRTSLGAMFTSLFLASATGLMRRNLLFTCMTIITIAMTVIVLLRLYGVLIDGVTDMNLSELRTEGISWLVLVSGWISCPRDEPK